MKRRWLRVGTIAGLALLLALLAFSFSPTGDVAAFDHVWVNTVSNNVAAGERGLWDDIAAGLPAMNEAGLLWLVNNEALDETVVYETTRINLSTSAFPVLTVRAALNDSALFRVGYALNSTTAPCVYPVALRWNAVDADGGYRIKAFTLPAGGAVRKICLNLTDNPDAAAIGRSNALIDYIRLRNAAGIIGWKEDFTGPP